MFTDMYHRDYNQILESPKGLEFWFYYLRCCFEQFSFSVPVSYVSGNTTTTTDFRDRYEDETNV